MRLKYYNPQLGDLFGQGQYLQAIELCQQLRAELSLKLGEQHPEVTAVLDDLAMAYFKVADYSASLETVKEVLRRDVATLGEESPDGARNLSNLGITFEKVGLKQEAELALERAYEIFERLPAEQQRFRPANLVALARFRIREKKFAAAQTLLLQATQQRLRDYDEYDPRYAAMFVVWGELLERHGKPHAARKAFQKAIWIYQAAGATVTIGYVGAISALAAFQARENLWEDAQSNYAAALDLLQKCHPGDACWIATLQQNLQSVKLFGSPIV